MKLRITAGVGLRISAVLTLLALVLMCWSLLVPTPLPVMVAMSVGQGLGTLAFAIYGLVVFKDITRARAEKKSVERMSLVNIEVPKPKSADGEADAPEEKAGS
jgi:hypothetical protein